MCLPMAVSARPLWRSWLFTRSVNANFFFADTLLLSAGLLLGVYELAAAASYRNEHDIADAAASRLQQVWLRVWRVRRKPSTLS